MQMTVTNGNARNKIPGQRVTFRARHGLTVCTIVPSVRAAKHRPALINLARATAWAEGVDRHKPASEDAEQLLRLFTDTKAALVVSHRRVFP